MNATPIPINNAHNGENGSVGVCAASGWGTMAAGVAGVSVFVVLAFIELAFVELAFVALSGIERVSGG
ncbi:hypothetical protein DZS_48320 [Dickeya ananatis]